MQAFVDLPAATQSTISRKLTYGREQLAAAVAAHRLGITASPCDRDVRVTEDRFLGKLPTAVLWRASGDALGVPSVGACLAWLSLSLRLRSICRGGFLHFPQFSSLEIGSISTHLIADLSAKATSLAADPTLSRTARWQLMQVAIEEAAQGDALLSEATEAAVAAAVQECVTDERDAVLCAKLQRLQGPLVVAVVGVAHVDGLAARWALQASAPAGGDRDAGELCAELCSARRPPLWRRVLGRPLLWAMRGVL